MQCIYNKAVKPDLKYEMLYIRLVPTHTAP